MPLAAQICIVFFVLCVISSVVVMSSVILSGMKNKEIEGYD